MWKYLDVFKRNESPKANRKDFKKVESPKMTLGRNYETVPVVRQTIESERVTLDIDHQSRQFNIQRPMTTQASRHDLPRQID